MKFIVIMITGLLLLSSCDNGKNEVTQKIKNIKPTTESDKNIPEELKEEDCDEKAEKAAEEVVLDLEKSGDAGCSIEDLQGDH